VNPSLNTPLPSLRESSERFDLCSFLSTWERALPWALPLLSLPLFSCFLHQFAPLWSSHPCPHITVSSLCHRPLVSLFFFQLFPSMSDIVRQSITLHLRRYPCSSQKPPIFKIKSKIKIFSPKTPPIPINVCA